MPKVSVEHALLFNAIAVYEKANTCCGPSGFRPGELAEAPLRVCQRCRMMLYCWRECQKEHWKWPASEAPHKEYCESMGKFWAALKSLAAEESALDMREQFRRAVEKKGLLAVG